MKPVLEPMLRCVVLAAAVAACESDGPAAGPVAAAGGHYLRETASEDLTVIIRIPAAVRALPGAGDRLVAEADADAADVARRAAERRDEALGAFTPSELQIEWTVAYDGGGVVSALGETFLYEGGVISSRTRETILYDRDAGREIGVADLFADPRANGPAMTALSDAAFAAWTRVSPHVGEDLALVDERTLVDARETLRPRAGSFAAFVLTPAESDPRRVGGVRLFYPPGALGPRADGAYALFVPISALAPHLAADWASRLGAAS